jgi:hypothetical protein
MCAAARDRQEPHGIAAPPRQKAFDMFVTDKGSAADLDAFLEAFNLPLVLSPRG